MRNLIRRAAWLMASITVVTACGTTVIGSPRASTPPPTLAPTNAPTALAIATLPLSGDIHPGTYALGTPFPVAFEITLGDGWSTYGAFEDGVLLAQHDFAPPGLVLFGAWQIDTLFADPCQHTLAPAVGDGVDALVAAFSAIPGLYAGAPTATTVGGRPATQLELAIPNDVDPATCVNDEYNLWGFHGEQTRYVPSGYRDVVEKVWILDVDGTRVVLSGGLSGGTDADVDALAAIIESIRFH